MTTTHMQRAAEVFAREATARAHQQADRDCGREWTCQCGACRWLRELEAHEKKDPAK